MRKIKLRIWNKRENGFHYPDREGRFFGITIGGLVCVATACDTLKIADVDEEGFQEYEAQLSTGLLDSDGKHIYEGDILEWSVSKDKANVENRGIVTFSEETGYMVGSLSLATVAFRSEIIGNNHEHAELAASLQKAKKQNV